MRRATYVVPPPENCSEKYGKIVLNLWEDCTKVVAYSSRTLLVQTCFCKIFQIIEFCVVNWTAYITVT